MSAMADRNQTIFRLFKRGPKQDHIAPGLLELDSILLVGLGGVSRTIQLLSCAELIRRNLPRCSLSVLTSSQFAALAHNHPAIQQVISCFDTDPENEDSDGPMTLYRASGILSGWLIKPPQAVICIDPVITPIHQAAFLAGRLTAGFDNAGGSLGLSVSTPWDPSIHPMQNHLRLLSRLNMHVLYIAPVIHASPEEIQTAIRATESPLDQTTVICLMRDRSQFVWGKDNYLSLIQYLIEKGQKPLILAESALRPEIDSLITETETGRAVVWMDPACSNLIALAHIAHQIIGPLCDATEILSANHKPALLFCSSQEKTDPPLGMHVRLLLYQPVHSDQNTQHERIINIPAAAVIDVLENFED